MDLAPDYRGLQTTTATAIDMSADWWPPVDAAGPSWWRVWRASFGRVWHFEAYGAGGSEMGEALSQAVAESRARRAMERLRDG